MLRARRRRRRRVGDGRCCATAPSTPAQIDAVDRRAARLLVRRGARRGRSSARTNCVPRSGDARSEARHRARRSARERPRRRLLRRPAADDLPLRHAELPPALRAERRARAAAPNSGVSSTDGSQPKSITDDGPPDHTWHRSLWYACGDLNGVDFYLEPAAMNMGYGPHVGTGYGRIVHRSFDWMASGPVWGGFQQRAQWVAPDGRVLLDDVRRFRMFRLKGRAAPLGHRGRLHAARRAGDVRPDERERAAADARRRHHRRVGRRHDVALDRRSPARRTASASAPSGPTAAARSRAPSVRSRRSSASRCSITRRTATTRTPGSSAATARSARTCRSSTAPLTLAPGETWSLRHRMYIHQGYADEGGVAGALRRVRAARVAGDALAIASGGDA